MAIQAAVFDLGQVLIQWDPRKSVEGILSSADQEIFFNEICNHNWNLKQDEGRSFAEAIAEVGLDHPQWFAAAQALWMNWEKSLVSEISQNVVVMRELKAKGLKILALSNWSAETFPIAERKYPFLAEMDGLLISSRERLVKPNPAFYQLIESRFGISLNSCVFIDDRADNCDTATKLGMSVIHYQGQDLRSAIAAQVPGYFACGV
jgi:2-haloacid dehalogenase